MASPLGIAHNHNFKNLVGVKFSRLTVASLAKVEKGRSYWLCDCDCGGQAVVPAGALGSGNTRSCGCLHGEAARKRATSHGLRALPEYQVWQNMKRRCYDSRNKRWERYGGRGIAVCRAWHESFQAFLADMGPRPTPRHQIDRRDNDGGYWCGHCPECVGDGRPANCGWATPQEQTRNSTHAHMLTFRGETLVVLDWARRTGLGESTIRARLRLGWTVERALTSPRCGSGGRRKKE